MVLTDKQSSPETNVKYSTECAEKENKGPNGSVIDFEEVMAYLKKNKLIHTEQILLAELKTMGIKKKQSQVQNGVSVSEEAIGLSEFLNQKESDEDGESEREMGEMSDDGQGDAMSDDGQGDAMSDDGQGDVDGESDAMSDDGDVQKVVEERGNEDRTVDRVEEKANEIERDVEGVGKEGVLHSDVKQAMQEIVDTVAFFVASKREDEIILEKSIDHLNATTEEELGHQLVEFAEIIGEESSSTGEDSSGDSNQESDYSTDEWDDDDDLGFRRVPAIREVDDIYDYVDDDDEYPDQEKDSDEETDLIEDDEYGSDGQLEQFSNSTSSASFISERSEREDVVDGILTSSDSQSPPPTSLENNIATSPLPEISETYTESDGEDIEVVNQNSKDVPNVSGDQQQTEDTENVVEVKDNDNSVPDEQEGEITSSPTTEKEIKSSPSKLNSTKKCENNEVVVLAEKRTEEENGENEDANCEKYENEVTEDPNSVQIDQEVPENEFLPEPEEQLTYLEVASKSLKKSKKSDTDNSELQLNIQTGVNDDDQTEEGEIDGEEEAESDSACTVDESNGEGTEQENTSAQFETLYLPVIHEKLKTGFEVEKDFPIKINSVIAGRYQIVEYLGSAAFSRAVQCYDKHTKEMVCIKIIKNNKDFFDQSLDEITLLRYINSQGDPDKHNVVRLYEYFYHKEHLFLVCELLRDNLYEFSKYNREHDDELYFTLPRLRKITRQLLEGLKFIHGLKLIHCDLKPENILIKSYSRCEVKIIDFGSSCFTHDHLCSYVQSRTYRAPEVILGLPYDQKIDVWSLGCIIAELLTGRVLFQNNSIQTMLARIIAICGEFDKEMLHNARYASKFFTKEFVLYEKDKKSSNISFLIPKKTSLRNRLDQPLNNDFVDFVRRCLILDPKQRISIDEALKHPWIVNADKNE